MMKKIKYIFLIVFFTIETVPDFRSTSLFWWGSVAALCMVFAYDSIKNKGNLLIKLGPFEKWYGIFVIYACFSILWAKDVDNTLNYIPSILVTCLVCVIVSQMICSEEDLEAVLLAKYISAVVLCLYIYMTIDLQVLGDERIGVDALGEGWNSNSIAFKLTIGCILGIEQLKHTKKKWLKFVILTSIVGMFLIMMLCGSRTAFIIAICGIAIYLWLSSRRHRFSVAFLIIGGVFALYYMVINIPELYNVLGSRLEILEEGLAGNTQSGSGTELRLTLMRDGINIFLNDPILGVGMNNFRNAFGEMYGVYKYSHSNHIEVLANFGIIGTAIFYYVFVYLLNLCIRQVGSGKPLNKYHILSICSVVTLMMSGFGTIFYVNSSSILLLVICFSGTNLTQNDDVPQITEADLNIKF